MNVDKEYKELVNRILTEGHKKDDRTGTGTISVFGHQMRFKMDEGFPLLTLRKIHQNSLVHELLWFLESYDKEYKKFGNTNIKYLLDNGVTFWTEWPYKEYKKQILDNYLNDDLKDEKTIKKLKLLSQKEFEKKITDDEYFALKWGDLGPVYGKQWTNWGGYKQKVEMKEEFNHTKGKSKVVNHLGWEEVNMKGINQISEVIDDLMENPDSRRHIISAWNVAEIDDMLLPPCHLLFQFYSFQKEGEEKRRLSLQLYQRSADVGLGVPFNIASYSLLLHMVANIVDMIPHEFVHTLGDAHIYNNHIKQLKEILERDSIECQPKVKIYNVDDIKNYRWKENFDIVDYKSHENIKMEVAV